jgi:sugar O-acyltransferase (sialic acid O-acetyltransferase NeuD family)
MRVLVIGAGGHGQVVADILLRMADAGSDVSIVGYLDDNLSLAGQRMLDLPVLGPLANLNAIPHDAVVVAVGGNKTRQRLASELASQGERFLTARHPRSVIAPDVSIGLGSMICAGVIVNTGSAIGAHAILNTGSTIDHHNQVGDFAHVAPGVHLGGDVHIGVGTLIGIGSTVLPQHSVGNWAVVGAGSTVIRDIPSGVTAVGTPARVR